MSSPIEAINFGGDGVVAPALTPAPFVSKLPPSTESISDELPEVTLNGKSASLRRHCDDPDQFFIAFDMMGWTPVKQVEGGFKDAYSNHYYLPGAKRKQPPIIPLVPSRADVVDNCLDLIKKRGELFHLGESKMLVAVEGDSVAKVSIDGLLDYLDRSAKFMSGDKVSHCPEYAARRVMVARHGLPVLNGVINAATLRMDGSILNKQGYDKASGLLLNCKTVNSKIIENPSIDDAKNALAELWRPFSKFPLVNSVDRGVVLSALLTSALRPSLPTSPGYGFDAPAAGTGKTLMAQAIGALATGRKTAALAPPGFDEDETRKKLFAAVISNQRVILWDNISSKHKFGNSAIDAFLTSETYQDRILGRSEIVEFPNNSLLMITGNNLKLNGDTFRRLLVARLDAEVEEPHMRVFDFNPVDYVIENRDDLISAALTLIRFGYGKRIGAGRIASFEKWDDFIRQTVCAVAEFDENFSDPSIAIKNQMVEGDQNKILSLMMGAQTEFGNDDFTVRDLFRSTQSGIISAIEEIADKVTPAFLGKWISRYEGVRVKGMFFERSKIKTGNATHWRVVKTKPTHELPKPTPEPTELIEPTPEPPELIEPTPEPPELIEPTPALTEPPKTRKHAEIIIRRAAAWCASTLPDDIAANSLSRRFIADCLENPAELSEPAETDREPAAGVVEAKELALAYLATNRKLDVIIADLRKDYPPTA
jgi:hypothetical protein